MTTNPAFWVVMAVCAFFMIGGIFWKEPVAVWIGGGIFLVTIVGTIISDAKKK